MKLLSILATGLFVLAFVAAAPTPTATPAAGATPGANPGAYPERWNYIGANIATDAGTAKFIEQLKASKEVGCTHVLMPEGASFRLDDQKPDYLVNAEKVKAVAKELKLTLVPVVFPTGYFGRYFHYDGNMAAGLPVKNETFIVKGKTATPDPALALDISKVTGLDTGKVSGSFKVQPFISYRLSFYTTGQMPEGEARESFVEVRSAKRVNGRSNPVVQDEGERKFVQTLFNTLEATDITLRINAPAKVEDLKIEPAGTLLLVRRSQVPLVVTSEDGKTTYKEGQDFKPLFDPVVNVKPFPGEFYIDHPAAPIELTDNSRIKDGDKLKVSFFHTVRIYNDQDVGALEDPQCWVLMEQDMKNTAKVWGASGYFMNYDEIRIGGWEKTDKTPGQMLAEHVKKATALVKKYAPDAKVYTWSDMFTPFHNAADKGNYYLVNGNWSGSWEGLPKDVIIMNWYAPAAEGVKFFADRGNPQVLSGYYDARNTAKMKANITRWMQTSKSQPGIRGFMYTTWHAEYDHLQEYFKLVDTYDQWGATQTPVPPPADH